jgi:Tfp pilus assembly protein PilF
MRNENVTNDPARGRATIGSPDTPSASVAAKYAFQAAENYMGSHNWAKAEESYRVALQFDGSVAKYHAALGSLLMTQRRWSEAEAEFSAAMLLDVDNADYRRLIKEARARR